MNGRIPTPDVAAELEHLRAEISRLIAENANLKAQLHDRDSSDEAKSAAGACAS